MALIISPPPNDQDVQGISWKQWFYKIRNELMQALDLTNVNGVLDTLHGGTGVSITPNPNELLVGNGTNFDLKTLVAGSNITIVNGVATITISATGGGGGSSKIYEPVVDTSSNFQFAGNGDILMAWGGDYAT